MPAQPPPLPPELNPVTLELPVGQDRRVHHRARLSLRVTMTGENGLYAGLTNDISAGGVFVALAYLPAVGSEVELNIDLGDGGEPLLVNGQVRWRRTRGPGVDGVPGIGVCFGALSERDIERLQALLDEKGSLLWEEP